MKEILSVDLPRFIQTRKALGYEAHNSSFYLKPFLEYCSEHYPLADAITRVMVDKWLLQRSFRTNATKSYAISDLRAFTRFQNTIGKHDYIPDEEYSIRVERYRPYIFTDKELQTLFHAIDSVPANFEAPNKELIVPVLFRMMFCCGMRPSEPLHLKRDDVNLASGDIFIRESKRKKDRYIMMSDDLMHLCRKYDSLIGARDWFFQKWDGDLFPTYWMTNQFRICWRNSGLLKRGNPRPYDLRHNFATRTLMRWVDEGKDVMALLPYLSVYMGHKHFTHTLYYIHLLPERLRSTAGIEWGKLDSIYGEVETDEDN
jgi:integrase